MCALFTTIIAFNRTTRRQQITSDNVALSDIYAQALRRLGPSRRNHARLCSVHLAA